MEMPKFRNYGNYSSDNYGAHAQAFEIDGIEYYFSYNTLVAFRSIKTGLVCRKNDWGTTAGKHLNWIQKDKSKRVNEEEFNKILSTLKE